MASRHVSRLTVVFAAIVAVGTVTGVALGAHRASAPTPLRIHAEFNSALIAPQDQPPDCAPPLFLVIGHGIGSGTHISDHAVGDAAECSLPVFPQDGTAPYFDVHGKGTYTTPDGSVMYLHYHETSENPFALGPPPWTLHDNGVWDIDPALSTGRFHGATGHGEIHAVVPITCDESFNCVAHVSADYSGTISFTPGH